MPVATDPLSVTLSALADPTRRAILQRLSTGDASVGELAAPFDLTGPGFSKHLKVLRTAGLVTQGREAQRRPCRLEPQAMREVTMWMEQFRASWDESFRRLDGFLTEMAKTEARAASPKPVRAKAAKR
jgi:DNA-binding transcriptional ArsR family regulator